MGRGKERVRCAKKKKKKNKKKKKKETGLLKAWKELVQIKVLLEQLV